MWGRVIIGTVVVVVGLYGQVQASDITAARTLRVGAIVSKSDLNIAETASPTLIEKLIGKELRRSVYVGRGISVEDVGPITVVDRNDVVRLSYQINGLWIRTEARAMEPGGINDMISVMNLATRVTVRAQVTGAKRARVVR